MQIIAQKNARHFQLGSACGGGAGDGHAQKVSRPGIVPECNGTLVDLHVLQDGARGLYNVGTLAVAATYRPGDFAAISMDGRVAYYTVMKAIMPVSVVVLLVFAAVVLLILMRWVYRLRLVGLEKAWVPEELQRATLVYTERVFRARSPVPIVAKLDRGYRNADGVVILVELKTRRMNRPYLSDVIELSAQRFAVQAQTGERVAHYGYVVIQPVGSKRKIAHRVALLSTDEVTAIAGRRARILAKEVVPQYAVSQGLCARCAFKVKCKQTTDSWA